MGIGVGLADTGSDAGSTGNGNNGDGEATGAWTMGIGSRAEAGNGAGSRAMELAGNIGGALGERNTWRASRASKTVAADGSEMPSTAGGRDGSGPEGMADGGIEAHRGAGAWTTSYCWYMLCIAVLNSSQLDGSSRASLTVVKVSSDISRLLVISAKCLDHCNILAETVVDTLEAGCLLAGV